MAREKSNTYLRAHFMSRGRAIRLFAVWENAVPFLLAAICPLAIYEMVRFNL